MDLNIILRGQSNALLFATYDGAGAMERQLEQKLGGGVDVEVLMRWDDPRGWNTINSGSAFLDWDTDGKQAGLVSYLNGLPESTQDDPTITLWMHNEYEQQNNPPTSQWVGEVRADASLVRGALGGQGASTTPYLFTWVPYPWGAGTESIQSGMRQLASDASFNAALALDAMNGIAMDGDGYPGSGHMGPNDAQIVAGRLAAALEPMARRLVDAAGNGGEAGGGAGGSTTPPPPPPASGGGGNQPASLAIGSGPDSLVLKVSQDAYNGSAQYTVRVDGAQIGGTLTASALRSSGQSDTVTVKGDWAAGNHTATVTFLNDDWGGTASTDRNLYVDGATYNGTAVPGAAKTLLSAGTQGFSFTDGSAATPQPAPAPAPASSSPVSATVGSGADSLVLKISQDAYRGSAQYTVAVDGRQVGGTLTASALRSSGQSDTVTVKGDWATGAHTATVTFLNDDWGGTAATDRNLYVDSATYNGAAVSGAARSLMSSGPADFGFTDGSAAAPQPAPAPAPAPSSPASLTVGSGADSLVLKISQDAYNGDAQYTVAVDGRQVGGTLTAKASHAAGQSDAVTVKGDWADGAHTATVTFLNDDWGGTPSTDRNLYLDGATYNGADVSGAAKSLMSAGPASFGFTDGAGTSPSTPPATGGGGSGAQPVSLAAGSGPDTLVLKISQDAYQGSAQYRVVVDGKQVGGTFTASASHASGQSDTLTLKGDWTAGQHKVEVWFLNDAWGGTAATDRNLYLDGATYNGAAVPGAAQGISSDWPPGSFGFLDAIA